jgi:hypothetical protein
MPCPSNSPWLVAYKLWCLSSCSLLQHPTTSSILSSNILLSTLFSDTLNLCSSLSVWDQVSWPHKTTGIISFVYFQLQVFERKWEGKRFWCQMFIWQSRFKLRSSGLWCNIALVEYEHFRGSGCLHLQHHSPLRWWYPTTPLRGITTQKTSTWMKYFCEKHTY